MEAESLELRARAYELLADLYLGGVSPETSPVLRDVPDLAEHLSDPPAERGERGGPSGERGGPLGERGGPLGERGGPLGERGAPSAEPEAPSGEQADARRVEMAAEHQRLFGREVFPYASAFLEPGGTLGGAVSDRTDRLFAGAGASRRGVSEPPDHLGCELRLLAHLVRTGDDERARAFLDSHLLWWLPVFLHSAGRVADSFWSAVLELTREVVMDHAEEVGVDGSEAQRPPELAAPPEDPLADASAGLRELAAYLVTPVRSGLFLSLGDLRALGRSARLPGGFGRRERVLANLLRSAGEYGGVGRVVEGIRGLVEGERRALSELPGPFAEPWRARLEGAERVVARLSKIE